MNTRTLTRSSIRGPGIAGLGLLTLFATAQGCDLGDGATLDHVQSTAESSAACPGSPATGSITPGTIVAPSCAATNYTLTSNIAYAPGASQRLDLYKPIAGAAPFPTVIWIHGGGWQSGDKTQVQQARWLVCRGYAVASINYRLSGEAKFPAAVHDVKAAIRYLRANAQSLGLDAARFALFGSSAGGHLAALAGASTGVASLEGSALGNPTVSSRVSAVVDWYGPTDFAQMDTLLGAQGCGTTNHSGPNSGESAFLGCTVGAPACAALVQQANPLTYADAQDPPHFIMHGTSDCVVPLAGSRALHDRLVAAPTCSAFRSVVGGGHGGTAWTTAAVQEPVAQFLEQAFTPAPSGPSVSCNNFVVTGNPRSTTGATWIYTSTDDGVPYRLQGVLFAPISGAGPFPGALVSHGKGGSPSSYSAPVGRTMAGWGMVAIGPMYTHAATDTPANTPDGGDGASEANVLRARKARDLLSCVGLVDMTRIAAHGHSMGGYVTGQLLGTYPLDFRAASHSAGGAGDGATPTKPEVAAQIVAPYQLHCGINDGQYAQNRRMVEILAANGVTTVLVDYTYPDMDHNRIAQDPTMLQRVRSWYTTHGVLP